MGSFMVLNFGTSGKGFTTCSANKRLVSSMNDFMHFQIMLRTEFFITLFAFVFFHTGMGTNVLR